MGIVDKWQQATACTAALVSAVAAAFGFSTRADEQPIIISSAPAADRHGSVRLMLPGKLTGLYPGAVKHIRPTLVNDTPFAVTLRNIEGWVAGTSRRAGCRPTRANLRILGYRGRLPVTVRPYRRLDLPGSIPVEMPTGASPQCSNTQFSIVVSGVGARSRR